MRPKPLMHWRNWTRAPTTGKARGGPASVFFNSSSQTRSRGTSRLSALPAAGFVTESSHYMIKRQKIVIFLIRKIDIVFVYIFSCACVLQGTAEGSDSPPAEFGKPSGGIHHSSSEKMGKRQQSPFIVTASVTGKTLFCHRRGSIHLDGFFFFNL